MLKYGFDDARPVLERASARETAARVAAGTIARAFLRQALGVEVLSHVISIGASEPYDGPPPQASDLAAIDASPVRAFDKDAEARMIAEIEAAKADGDTLGGVVEVVANGLPIGLGSFTSGDNRLDSQLAGAVMGIQAIKGVEIGDGFETARRRGSVAHDEMYPGPGGVMRSTNRAGGLEGGMTNGQPLRVRAAMKPISTVPRALATVDMATGDEAVAIHQRSDVCAVPAAGVVVETMVALVLARAALEKFGGDSLAETRANLDTYLRAVRRGETQSAASRLNTRRRRADGPQGGIDRACPARASRRSVGGWPSRSASRCWTPTRRSSRPPAAPFPTSSPTTARRSSAASRRKSFARRWNHTTACCRSAAARSPVPVCAKHFPDTPSSTSRSAPPRASRRTGGTTVRPLLAGGDRAEKFRALMSATGSAVPAGGHDPRQHQPPKSRCRGALHRVAAGESARRRRPAQTQAATAPPPVVAPHAGVVDAEPVRGHHAGQPCGVGPPRRGPP